MIRKQKTWAEKWPKPDSDIKIQSAAYRRRKWMSGSTLRVSAWKWDIYHLSQLLQRLNFLLQDWKVMRVFARQSETMFSGWKCCSLKALKQILCILPPHKVSSKIEDEHWEALTHRLLTRCWKPWAFRWVILSCAKSLMLFWELILCFTPWSIQTKAIFFCPPFWEKADSHVTEFIL